jgi:hypothetical protein
MCAPGEGEAAQAVQERCGGGHTEEESLIVDMDQKAKEHEYVLYERGRR